MPSSTVVTLVCGMVTALSSVKSVGLLVRFAFLLYHLDPLGDKAGAVFKAANAVFVGAGVVGAGEEVLAHVEAGGVHLDRFEAHGLEALGDGEAARLDRVDVVDAHVVLVHAELRPLIAEARAVLGALLYQLFAEGHGLRRHLAAVHGRLQRGNALDVDQLNAALGEVHIVFQQLVGEAGEVAGGARGGFDHAVAQLKRTDLQRGEQDAQFLIV